MNGSTLLRTRDPLRGRPFFISVGRSGGGEAARRAQ